MNAINRREQKVVCVATINVWIGNTVETLQLYDGPTPEPERVYTVDGFIESGFILDAPRSGSLPGIALVEIPCSLTSATMEPLGWPIAAFRPLDERATDISALLCITAPAEEMAQ